MKLLKKKKQYQLCYVGNIILNSICMTFQGLYVSVMNWVDMDALESF